MNSDDLVKIAGIVLVALLLLYLVYSYNQKCKLRDNEAFAAAADQRNGVKPQDPQAQQFSDVPQISGFENAPVPAAAAPAAASAGASDKAQPNDCYPRDRLTAADLLPSDAVDSTWAKVNPAGQGDIKDQNFLTAGHHVGINTVGSTLRNANLQLRSDPVNPQLNVSPWNQTTIEPDSNHRALEIGGDF